MKECEIKRNSLSYEEQKRYDKLYTVIEYRCEVCSGSGELDIDGEAIPCDVCDGFGISNLWDRLKED